MHIMERENNYADNFSYWCGRLYITDALLRLHGKTATLKRRFSHSGTTTSTLSV